MALTYAKAGVDIEIENQAIAALAKQLTYKRKGIGALWQMLAIMRALLILGNMLLPWQQMVLVQRYWQTMKRWNTVGIDCIAMNSDDLRGMGIEPLCIVIISQYMNQIMR